MTHNKINSTLLKRKEILKHMECHCAPPSVGTLNKFIFLKPLPRNPSETLVARKYYRSLFFLQMKSLARMPLVGCICPIKWMSIYDSLHRFLALD